MTLLLVLNLLLLILIPPSLLILERCSTWASSGECTANPTYMLRNCGKSCRPFVTAKNNAVATFTDFYDISERDIYGNLVYFEQFRGQTVFVVNVASQCGYTAENYKLLQQLSSLRSKHFEILIFPCNQVSNLPLLVFLFCVCVCVCLLACSCPPLSFAAVRGPGAG